MFQDERLNHILAIMTDKKVISINELSKLTFCSLSTLRRDLIKLEQTGKIKRHHGKISLISDTNIEFSYIFREVEAISQKQYMCHLAEPYIENNQAFFLDSSSTVFYLASAFKETLNTTVITNGIKLALQLHTHNNINIFITGGQISTSSNSILGEFSSDFIQKFHADIAFISCRGLDKNGLYEANYNQALVKQHMINNASKVILLCHNEKFNHVHFFKLATFKDIDVIITDKKPDDELMKIIEASGCEVIW